MKELFEGVSISSIKHILIGDHVLKEVPYLLKDLGVKKQITVICDQNTYNSAGREVIGYLNGFDLTLCKFDEQHLIPDEKAIGEIILKMNPQSEFLCAIGSGTINDLTRFVSFKTKIPYGIIATAPSMDGYASSVSPLIVNGFKSTYSAGYPQFVVGDLDVLSKAPYDMITAGFGDIIGKYTALADWMISSVVNGEHFSDDIANIVRNSIEKCVNSAEKLKDRDKAIVENVMDALVLSGIAMLKVGNSRPASGAEHHIAHYIEIKMLMEGKRPPFHGTCVGIAEVLVTDIYHKIFSLSVDDVENFMSHGKFETKSEYEKRINNVYGSLAKEIFEEVGDFYMDEEKRKRRQKMIISNWNDLKAWVEKNLPTSDQIKKLLKQINAPTSLNEAGVDDLKIEEIMQNAKEIRKRYTIFRFADDIGFNIKFLK